MEITITVMSRAILNYNAISVRSDTRAYLRSAPSWKRITSHRIASLLFPRINECHSFLVVGGRNGSGGGRVSLLSEGKTPGGWGGWRSGEPVAVLFSESPRYP